MGFGGVPVGLDRRVLRQHAVDGRALDPYPASVHEADFRQSRFVGGVDELLDHRRNITRRERMQVERAFDRDAVRHAAAV